jgi:glucuronate isomerase
MEAAVSDALRQRIFDELDRLVLIDPHTHINPHAPASSTLADVLGYHYYTELAHSAGMPRERIEEPGLPPREKVRRLVERLGPIENTIQYSWLIEMLREFFDFADERLSPANWEGVYDRAAAKMSAPNWADDVLRRSKLEAVFLTNDFDDPLTGFDTKLYIPCLRTDDLVFHLGKPQVQQRLAKSSGVSVHNAATLRAAVGKLFEHFTSRGARACAISLPPDFAPTRIDEKTADAALQYVLARGPDADANRRRDLANFVFWTLAEYCAEFRLPFDLMIGVNRAVYASGVYQGQDLYDSRVSLIQYRELFNAFGQVTFPISVLASVTNQELVSYAWIFPNVVTNGHWWYSNTPAYIEHDLAARLEAVPQTKQIGYYSDMYKLEFALPKFAMFKRILAKVLAESFVIDRGWSEKRAVELGHTVLRGNVERVFGFAT